MGRGIADQKVARRQPFGASVGRIYPAREPGNQWQSDLRRGRIPDPFVGSNGRCWDVSRGRLL